VPDLLGNAPEKRNHVLRGPGELGAKLRLLRSHAHRAGVEVALAGHDATLRDQGRGPEIESPRAQEGRHHDVPAGLEAPVHAQAHPARKPFLTRTCCASRPVRTPRESPRS
jgi:hypothetical protein